MLHGLALAEALLPRLRSDPADRALALQLPPWTTRTPGTLFAVALQRGAILHLLAIVDTWNLTCSPPPALRARFAARWEWSNEGPTVDAIAETIAALGRAWLDEAPDEVGVLDVLGALTHSGGGALGERRGPWGNLVSAAHTATDRNGLHGELGRVRTDPQWPVLASVATHAEGIAIGIRDAPSPIVLRTATELVAKLPAITEALRVSDDACANAAVRQLELRAAAEQVGKLVAPLAGTWSASVPYLLDVGAPSVSLTSAAPIGGTATIRFTARGERAIAIDVGSVNVQADHAGSIEALVPSLREAFTREATTLRSWRLVAGERYRVKRALRHLPLGAIVQFREVYEVKPSGADHWAFESVAGALVLASDDASDVAILETLDDYLAPVT